MTWRKMGYGNTPTAFRDFPIESPVWSNDGWDDYGQPTTLRVYVYRGAIYFRSNYDGIVEQEYQPSEEEVQQLIAALTGPR